MATESPLAYLYNDQAPLEHHHLAIMFQILRREGCDILGHLEKPQRVRARDRDRESAQCLVAIDCEEGFRGYTGGGVAHVPSQDLEFGIVGCVMYA